MRKHENIFVLDTNFFISAFEKNPSLISSFTEKTKKIDIQLLISSHIIKEIRWYLRRRIISEIKVEEVSNKELREIRKELEKKKCPSPHFPDLSNIVLAKKENGCVVTSDLQLIKACEKLNVPVIMSSSFLIFLKENTPRFKEKEFFDKLYDIVLSDEIEHSVEQSEKYDPVNKIKEIQMHAIKILQNLPTVSTTEVEKLFFINEESELLELINEIEFEIPNYINQIKEGKDLEALQIELKDIYNQITDIIWKIRLLLKTEKSLVLETSTRIKARILFILSIVEFTLLDFNKLESTLELLSEIATVSPEMVSDIFMDLQFLRMVFFLITHNYFRLKGFFSDEFLLLCEIEKRKDLTKLTRVIIFASTILESRVIDKNALLDGKEEIQLLFQLGYIFLQTSEIENALLLLMQTHYLAIRTRNKEIIRSTLELLIVIHYISNENITTEIEQGIRKLKEIDPFDVQIFSLNNEFDFSLLTSLDYTHINELPEPIKKWFYIYDYQLEYKEGKRITSIFVINPYFSPRAVFVTTQTLPQYELRPGRQIKIIDGILRIKKCSNENKKKNVDLIIEVEKPLFSLRDPWGMKILR